MLLNFFVIAEIRYKQKYCGLEGWLFWLSRRTGNWYCQFMLRFFPKVFFVIFTQPQPEYGCYNLKNDSAAQISETINLRTALRTISSSIKPFLNLSVIILKTFKDRKRVLFKTLVSTRIYLWMSRASFNVIHMRHVWSLSATIFLYWKGFARTLIVNALGQAILCMEKKACSQTIFLPSTASAIPLCTQGPRNLWQN